MKIEKNKKRLDQKMNSTETLWILGDIYGFHSPVINDPVPETVVEGPGNPGFMCKCGFILPNVQCLEYHVYNHCILPYIPELKPELKTELKTNRRKRKRR